ncbi:glycosyltransferase involved in cell wall biosynthesis [Nocardioides ginsengisegetis]|uniref:Glycosyltransferase involved in cell wall biosynthesis n=1 Tax=Nocardioides ginsengisegetis TaxID=661491 RepID=A0A7W3P7S8_9ACTN|nr:glycosyltransferase involved in cell wall biosynthesis [Nocardioides ginsengisegetis]
MLGVNYAPEPTGIAPYTATMCRGLVARGHHVEVVTAFPHYPQWQLQPGDRRTLTRRDVRDGLGVTRVRHYVPARPTGIPRALSEISFGARLVTRSWGRPDVVICLSPALLATAMAAARTKSLGSGPALGIVVQDLYSAGVGETGSGGSVLARIFGRLESTVLGRADGVAVIHDRFKHTVVNRLGADAGRVAVIRNWTHVKPVQDFDKPAFRARMGWRTDETVVLHAGAMGEKQDLSNVVAAAQLSQSRSLPLRFVLMGDGGQRVSLERQGAGVSAIEVIPPLPDEDFGRALRAADVLLVNERPGLNEMAVPSKLTSYFSSGTAVLAATEATSTTAEELAAAGAGLRVGPGDPGALVSGVLTLRNDPLTLDELGRRGPDYCARVLSEEVALDAYDDWVRLLHRRKQEC